MDPVPFIFDLFDRHGSRAYTMDRVSQLDHALQCADLACQADHSKAFVAAALLHDIGHMLHRNPPDSAQVERDLFHERVGSTWLARYFKPEITEPIRLHVAAKRYLCARDPGYVQYLSEASVHSLALQGGPMDQREQAAFKASPHHEAAIELRRIDEQAKIYGLRTAPLERYHSLLEELVCRQ